MNNEDPQIPTIAHNVMQLGLDDMFILGGAILLVMGITYLLGYSAGQNKGREEGMQQGIKLMRDR